MTSIKARKLPDFSVEPIFMSLIVFLFCFQFYGCRAKLEATKISGAKDPEIEESGPNPKQTVDTSKEIEEINFYLETKSDGSGFAVGSNLLEIGQTFHVFGISRNSGGKFLKPVRMDWALSGNSGKLTILQEGIEAIFTALKQGSSQVTANIDGIDFEIGFEVFDGSPSITRNEILVVHEGDGRIAGVPPQIITLQKLHATDPTQIDSEVLVYIDKLPLRGIIKNINSLDNYKIGDYFSIEDVKNRVVSYIHTGPKLSDNGGRQTDDFHFHIEDGSFSTENQQFNFRIYSFCDSKTGATKYYQFGIGTRKSPYIICTADQLNDIGLNPEAYDKNFQLRANIDLSQFVGNQFNIIGTKLLPFTGVFDGNNNRISNFTFDDSPDSLSDVGIFGHVSGASAKVLNFQAINVNVKGFDQVGGIVGSLESGQMTNLKVSGFIEGRNSVGGIVGVAEKGAVLSTLNANVTVNSTGEYTGGVAGFLNEQSLIYSSSSSGTVNGVSYVGGFVGNGTLVTVYNSYSAANTTGSLNYVGGFAGYSYNSTYKKIFSIGDVTGKSTTSEIGRMFGRGGASIDSYHNSDSNCINTEIGFSCNVSASTGVSLSSGANYFTDKTNPPLSGWRISGTWEFQIGSLPEISPLLFDADTWGTCADHQSLSDFAGGSGTAENPYLICNASQWAVLGQNSNLWTANHFKVMADINLNDFDANTYAIPGVSGQPLLNSVIDGNNKIFRNFTYIDPSHTNVGLLGLIDGAIVKSVGLENVNVSGLNNVGALVGYSNGNIRNSAVLESYSKNGTVTGTGSGAGGLIGKSHYHVYESKLFSNLSIQGGESVGGINGSSNTHIISDSFFTGTIAGTTTIGPVIGGKNGGSEDNVYYLDSACDASCDNIVGISEPQIENFYSSDFSPMKNWDFVNVWQENDNDLPSFRSNFLGKGSAPLALGFRNSFEVKKNLVVESNVVEIKNTNVPLPLSFTGDLDGEYRLCSTLNCSTITVPWSPLSNSIVVESGKFVQLRLTSANAFSTERILNINIGSMSSEWLVKTEVFDSPKMLLLPELTSELNISGVDKLGDTAEYSLQNIGSRASEKLNTPVVSSENPNYFEIYLDSCTGKILKVGAVCTFSIRATATDNGLFDGAVSITDGISQSQNAVIYGVSSGF